jgi:hypothetical protein
MAKETKKQEAAKETQELTLVSNNIPMVADDAPTLAEMGFSPEDVVLPRILLEQPSSALVQEGKFQMGDIINSVTNTRLAAKNTPLEVIPISHSKSITVLESGSGKFVTSLPYDPAMKQLEFEGERDGKRVKNYLTYNFYVLLPTMIDEGDVLPMLISFRSTSLKAGKTLNNHFMNAAMLRQAPYAFSANISTTFAKNEKGGFFVWNIAKGKKVDEKYLSIAKFWANALKTQTYKTDSVEKELDAREAVVTDEEGDY